MIEDEEDSVFTMSNALIKVNPVTDTLHFYKQQKSSVNSNDSKIPDSILIRDSITVDKALKLINVQFINYDFIDDGRSHVEGGWFRINFKQSVELINPYAFKVSHSTFHKGLTIRTDHNYLHVYNALEPYRAVISKSGASVYNDDIYIDACQIEKKIDINRDLKEINNKSLVLSITKSTLPPIGLLTALQVSNQRLILKDNTFESLILFPENMVSTTIESNVFKRTPLFLFRGSGELLISENSFEEYIVFSSEDSEISAEWDQWFGKYTPFFYTRFLNLEMENSLRGMAGMINLAVEKESVLLYQDSIRASNKRAFLDLRKELARYYNDFKKDHNTENANLVYREIKNLETQRFAYLYKLNPNFSTFFKWRINQFLKVFSAYGTEPERAIIFSLYVILAFALVYLFFPNYWDSHGKNRIMDRYRFFLKYVNKDSGMHEVYLDEKKPELLASEDFRAYLQEQGKTAPKFFMATALPLYRWSVAGMRTFSWMLSKVDILKGKWSDTEDSKKGGKSILLIGAFLIALLYDIFIKVLNALMLSINTFTTLGFGEIPIEGLPRYLAIIQGFIGWFMLTIFSVSLISQLLN